MIYIMAHNKIDFNFFHADKNLDKNMFQFFLAEGKNKNSKNINDLIYRVKDEGFGCNLEWELDEYDANLQRNSWHAPSILYHTYINNLTKDMSHVGFIEYDLHFTLDEKIETSLCRSKINGFSFSNVLKEIISLESEKRFIILPSIRHSLHRLDIQHDITMCGKHWLRFFIEDYNKRYDCNHTYENILEKYSNTLVAGQQSFICDVQTFRKIGKYVFDFTKKYGYEDISIYRPRPSTIIERYIGMFILLNIVPDVDMHVIPLIHMHSSGGIYE